MKKMKKNKKQYILGIETSCDETAAAILVNEKDDDLKELAAVISSQIEIHQKYGGVVPEVAAREHVLNILPVLNEAFKKAKIKPDDLSAIGITAGPGLITSLVSGVETAKSLAYIWQKPLIPINHIEGHIYANFIKNNEEIKFPAIILTVSGGHTILLIMNKKKQIKVIGETRDDAAGEAYDKGAKMLGLGYPGGPIISKLAEEYIKSEAQASKGFLKPIKFPRPMIDSPDFDFSFSGLKTSLLYELKKDKNWKKRINEYCFYYQEAIIDVLVKKTIKAAKEFKTKTVMLTGGVSANKELRSRMEAEVIANFKEKVNFLVPKLEHTTDNASMIAASAFFKLKAKKSWPFMKVKANPGAGLK